MTARLAEEHLAARAAGTVTLVPDWLTAAVLADMSPLAAARRQAGLDLAETAAHAGLGVDVLAALEEGRRSGTPAEIEAIARACGVDPALLLDQGPVPAPSEGTAGRPRRRSARRR
jgi:transcriptional regulator with XRE-family HTH domain